MTHLLATLLTGGRFGPVARNGEPRPATPESGEAFGRVLEQAGRRRGEERTDATAERPTTEGSREAAAGDDGSSGRTPGTAPAPGTDGGDPAPGTRITLLGATPGMRPNLPSLTFLLPAGTGPADLAAAVRTQVLRMVAARQLEPGALENLRLAISSREMGQVDVEMNASGERLKIEIVTSGREAETALRRSGGDLRDAILARSDRFRLVEIRVDGRDVGDPEEGGEENRDRSGRGGQEGGNPRDSRERDPDGRSGRDA